MSRLPGFKFVGAGTGTHRRYRELIAQLLGHRLIHNVQTLGHRDVAQHGGTGSIQLYNEGGVVLGDGLDDVAGDLHAQARLNTLVKGVLHILGGQGISIVELNVVPQVEGVGQSILGNFPGFRHIGLDLTCVVHIQQTFVHVLNNAGVGLRVIGGGARLQCGGFVDNADHQVCTGLAIGLPVVSTASGVSTASAAGERHHGCKGQRD